MSIDKRCSAGWRWAIKLLVAEADTSLREALSVALVFKWSDAVVLTAESVDEAREILWEERPDVVLLDTNLPHGGGMSFLKEVRRHSETPVLMLSSSHDDEKQIQALRAGADDYLVKPFGMLALLARVDAVTRRARPQSQPGRPADVDIGGLHVDYVAQQARLGSTPISLTPNEFKLLVCLVRYPDRVISQRLLIESIWGGDAHPTTHNLTALVSRLRSKLERRPGSHRFIATEPGVGYRFVTPTPPPPIVIPQHLRAEPSPRQPVDEPTVLPIAPKGVRRDGPAKRPDPPRTASRGVS
jgi:two-component system KDP operon response regulator KdpE